MTVGGLYFYGSCSHGLQVSCGGCRGWPRRGGGRGEFFAAARNGVAVRIVAFAPNDFWQDSSSSIDKPVANLNGNNTLMQSRSFPPSLLLF